MAGPAALLLPRRMHAPSISQTPGPAPTMSACHECASSFSMMAFGSMLDASLLSVLGPAHLRLEATAIS